ncbi:hypothetical protein NDU88_005292 [Pleurodeles waltl]|uniref:Uncharacterized protein n=1 Tax=Pleurodeles waltl TaxID=8319 RepID=A0AAV7VIK7_PLEWA|nr:hypothetical protein NDU88_005292 [Pleurodeles waltl]
MAPHDTRQDERKSRLEDTHSPPARREWRGREHSEGPPIPCQPWGEGPTAGKGHKSHRETRAHRRNAEESRERSQGLRRDKKLGPRVQEGNHPVSNTSPRGQLTDDGRRDLEGGPCSTFAPSPHRLLPRPSTTRERGESNRKSNRKPGTDRGALNR